MGELERRESESDEVFEQRMRDHAEYLRVQAKPWFYRDRTTSLIASLMVILATASLALIVAGEAFTLLYLCVCIAWVVWVLRSKRWD
jgi:hypothetical protein